MPKQFTPFICKFDDDQEWYRAQVVATHGGVITVLFVDFGNKQTIAKAEWTSKAKIPSEILLKKEIIYIPVQDMSLFDKGTEEIMFDLDQILGLLDNDNLDWTVVPAKNYGGNFTDDWFEGQIHVNGVPLLDYLNGSGDAPAQPQIEPVSTASSTVALDRFKTKVPKEIKEVYISAIDHDHLWLTRVDKEDERDKYVADLESIIAELRPLADQEIDIGTPCIARSTSKLIN